MCPRETDFADGGDPYERIYEFCQEAEALGFEFATFTHHRFSPERPHLSSPFVIMSAIAARTTKLKLITTIFVLPLYHPLDVAEAVASLDHVSGGRVVLGVGTGYRQYEADAVGVPFDKRVSRMTESIAILRSAWTQTSITHHGQHFDLDAVTVVPKPVQRPHPPIWIGALENKPVERAGRIADGWIAPYIQRADTLAERAARYRDAAARAGRPPVICLERDCAAAASRDDAQRAWLLRNVPLANYYRAHGAPLPDWPDTESPSFAEVAAGGRTVAGTPDDCIASLKDVESTIGCEYLSLMNMGTGASYGHAGAYDTELAAMRLFGREVLPAFK